jgi:hypothetical protein
MPRTNPTSSIRCGFDYQTGWAIKIIVDWLKNPEIFAWIQFETVPDEIDDSKFYLDDIIVCDSEGYYKLYQLKYKQHPSDPGQFWTFEKFLETTGKKGTSLFRKWSLSIFKEKLSGKIRTAELVTNGQPDEYFNRFIENSRLNILRVKQEDTVLFSTICSEIGSEEKVIEFFSKFYFSFGNLSVDDLEKDVQTELLNKLKVTKHGFTNLFHNISKISRSQLPERLDINTIRKFCEFDDPRPLNQEFSIPADFELYDTTRHSKLITDLASINGGVKIIYGKPGVGKSTYLAKLSENLKKMGYFVVKHQYFISTSDPDSSERLLPYRVIESLKAEFKKAPEYLGPLTQQNSAGIPLQEFLKQISLGCRESGKPFIFIIDGLDHVVRFKDQEALKELLKEISIPEKGLWLILGTQESAFDYIPLDIRTRCSTNDWIEIRGLKRHAIENIIKKNECGLNLPQQNIQIKELSNRIFELTEGNPLILRYSLRELKNNFGRKTITAYDCADILPYSGEIQTYYEQLWQKISNESKTLLISISSVSFKFSKDQLTDFLTHCFSDPSKVSLAFKSVSHILGEQNGKYSIFHTSFGLFIVDQKEFQEQEKGIKQRIVDWFHISEYEELQWAEEKKLYYDLGNSKPILSIDEHWVFDALCYPRDARQIISQLSVANEAAFKEKKFGAALKFSKLHDYLIELNQNSDEAKLLWNESIKQGNRDFSEIPLEDLSSSQLYYSCCELEDLGVLSIYLPRIKKCFNNLLRNLKIQPKSESFEALPELPIFIIRIMALDRTYPLDKVQEFIKFFDKYGWGDDLFRKYITDLLTREQSLKIDTIYKNRLSKSKRYGLLIQLVKTDLLKNSSYFLTMINDINQSELPLPCLFYLCLRDCEIAQSLTLPDESALEELSTENGLLFKESEAEKYINVFYTGLLFSLMGRNNELTSWINKHESNTNWSINVTKRFFQTIINIHEKIRNHDEIQVSEIFCGLSDLPQPGSEHVLTNSGLIRAIQNVAKEILTISYFLKIKYSEDPHISQDDLRRIQFNTWLSRENFLEWMLSFNGSILTESAFTEYLTNELEFWKHNIVPFSERANHYIKLANLCRYYQSQKYDELLKLGARNLVAYGYHKDMFLDSIIESIRICHSMQSPKIQQWVKEIEQPVEFISEYTDGDETGHFPMTYANLLGEINPQLLFKHYFTAIKNEDFYPAEQFFADILTTLDYNEEINQSIAATALDKYSFKTLQSLSEDGDLQAKQVKSRIENQFGSIIFPKEGTPFSESLLPEPVPDYNQVSFDSLSEHLQSIDGNWESEKYLDGWIKHQLSQPTPDHKAIYETIVKIVDQFPSRRFLRETLDLLYPLAYHFDSEKAFYYAVLAQAHSRGWFEYWSDKQDAYNRWQFIKDYYPKRYLEFYEQSIFLTGKDSSYPYGYFVPIPRSLEFFSLFNQLDLAEEITQASVDTLKLLMADVEFPPVQWVQYPDVDEFDILLSRLKWPSPLVRERAATEIARLLCDASVRETIFTKLTGWIQQQTLESLVLIGLLPLIKSAENDPHTKTWLGIDTILNCLPFSSILIDKLISELSLVLEQPCEIHIDHMSISKLPEGYTTPEKFGQEVRQFLSRGYWWDAKEISKNTGFNFIENWAATSNEIIKKLHFSMNVQNIGSYHGYQHQPQLIGLSSNMSEIYRSAYLRVLEHCFKTGLLSDDNFNFVYSTMPIDLSFWNVKTGRCPQWWPQLNLSDDITERNIDQINTQITSNLKRFLQEQSDLKVLAIDGAIKPFTGWTGKITSTIKLIGFSYSNYNESNIDETEFAQYILNPPICFIVPSVNRPFRFLELDDQRVENRSPFFLYSDVMGSHLIDRFYLFPICQWQWYRFIMGSPIGLSSELTMNASIKVKDGIWGYYQGDSCIAECCDWLEGLHERVREGEIVPYGKYIQIDAPHMLKYLEKSESQLRYAVEITHDIRKYSHEEPKLVKSYKIITIKDSDTE